MMKIAEKKKRIPRNIRKNLERELRKAEKDLTSNAFMMISGSADKLARYPQNEIGFIKLKTLDEKWFKESGGEFLDPHERDKKGNPVSKQIRLDEFITFERGKVKIDGKVKECVKPISVNIKKVVKYFEDSYGKANLKECLPTKERNELLETLVNGEQCWPTPSVYESS